MLRLYQGNRLEYLSDLLGRLLVDDPLDDPLASEQIVVPHPGMGRWLALQLAQATGICANVAFPLPAGFIWEQLRRLLPDVPEKDRFAPDILRWALFEELAEVGEESLFAPLHPFLQAQGTAGRFDLADRLARGFDRYLVYRPEWILAWEEGRPAVPGDAWQGELWRRISARLGGGHWARQQQRLFRAAEQGRLDGVGLPQRVCLFGITALSPGYLQTLVLLSRWIEVHLFLPNPCAAEWMGLVDETLLERRRQEALEAADYLEVGHPLLASLGRPGREFLAQLQGLEAASVELFHPPTGDGLLAAIQRDILALRDPVADGPVTVPSPDDSVRVHSCHGPMRELEVLHDQLLDLFREHPDLQPDDVLVMTPDMARYGPYIEAVFGSAPADRRIPFSLADAGGSDDSLTAAFLELLELPGGRLPVDRVVELLEVPAIQRRFGLTPGDLPLLIHWLRQAGVRWGWDASSRADQGVPAAPDNTWRLGLDRLLLGMALPAESERLFHGLLPAGDAEGGEARLVGALTGFAEALARTSEQFQRDAEMAEWERHLAALISRFFAPDDQEETQLQRIRDAIADLATQVTLAGASGRVPLELLRRRLQEGLGAAAGGFLRGGVTFCALTPMRSLPAEVICLIGMNDGSFPRDQHLPGFDLMAEKRRPGDRERRDDDRYLFLECLLSARRHFYVSYTGQDARDNAPLPPSPLVDELLDLLADGYRLPSGDAASAGLPVRHPLQPFDRRYFEQGTALFSYSGQMARAATRLDRGEAHPFRFFVQPLSPPGPEWHALDLADLGYFFSNPSRYLLRRRLDVVLETMAEELDPRDPFALEWEDRQRIGRRLLDAALAGGSPAPVLALERAGGRLPQGATGEALLTRQWQKIASQAMRAREEGGWPGDEQREFRLRIGDWILSGRLDHLSPAGIRGCDPGQLPAARLLRLWLHHLVLNAVRPDGIEPETRWLHADGVLRLAPREDAAERLGELLELYRQGLQRPLPLFPRSSLEYAKAVAGGRSPEQALAGAERVWRGEHSDRPESADPYHRLAFSGREALAGDFPAVSEACFAPLLAALEEA